MSLIDARQPADGHVIEADICNDFRTGRVLKLEGWTLSLTELRLCALAHLQEPLDARG